jgi:hypothetical protein
MRPGLAILEGNRSEAARPCRGDADTDSIAETGE